VGATTVDHALDHDVLAVLRAVAQVEAAVLPRAARLSVLRLRARTRRELMRLDAAASERRQKDVMRTADVTLHRAAAGVRVTHATARRRPPTVLSYPLATMVGSMDHRK
jgi:hypothetical protein